MRGSLLTIGLIGMLLSAQDAMQMVEGWKQRLKLTDAQSAQVKQLVAKRVETMQALADRRESGQADSQAMRAAMKQAKEEFNSGMNAVLNDSQMKEMAAIHQEMQVLAIAKMADRRVASFEKKYGVNADQGARLKPVFQKEMVEMAEFLEEHKGAGGGEQMSKRQKRQALKSLREAKDIQEDADKAIAQILTKDQMDKYKADEEKRKAEMKAKMQQKRGR